MLEGIISELGREYLKKVEGLTKEQFTEALKQAIACGDFMKQVVVSGELRQQVLYIPYAREKELQARIKELEEIIEKWEDRSMMTSEEL